MKNLVIKNWFYIMGLLVGVVAGFIYWNYVGCLTGTCSITANPYRSMAYFGIMGAILLGTFKRKKI